MWIFLHRNVETRVKLSLVSFSLRVEWYIICGGLHNISKIDSLTASSLGVFSQNEYLFSFLISMQFFTENNPMVSVHLGSMLCISSKRIFLKIEAFDQSNFESS